MCTHILANTHAHTHTQARGIVHDAILGAIADMLQGGGCARPADVPPPACAARVGGGGGGYRAVGVAEELLCLLSHGPLVRAVLSQVEGSGGEEGRERVRRVFAGALVGLAQRLWECVREGGAEGVGGMSWGEALRATMQGPYPALRELWTHEFLAPIGTVAPTPSAAYAMMGGAAGAGMFPGGRAGLSRKQKESAVYADLRTRWRAALGAIKHALPLKDAAFQRAFFVFLDRVLGAVPRERPFFASEEGCETAVPRVGDVAAFNCAAILALFAEPFLAPDSPKHLNFARFPALWYHSVPWWREGGAGGAEEGSRQSLEHEENVSKMRTAAGHGGFVTDIWFLCLKGLNRAVIPAMAAREHWCNQRRCVPPDALATAQAADVGPGGAGLAREEAMSHALNVLLSDGMEGLVAVRGMQTLLLKVDLLI